MHGMVRLACGNSDGTQVVFQAQANVVDMAPNISKPDRPVDRLKMLICQTQMVSRISIHRFGLGRIIASSIQKLPRSSP